MKRDLDLARKLLLDIEDRGSDCSVSVLRSGPEHVNEDRIRHHLRLLIDAGLLKEVDRTSSGVPCVRLTHEGHELIELSRNESLWREAKWICQDRLGGLSLTVIRQLLLQMTLTPPVEYAAVNYARPRRTYVTRRHLESSGYRVEPYHTVDRVGPADAADEGRVRYVRVRPEMNGTEERIARYGVDWEDEVPVTVRRDGALPAHLI